MAAHKPAKAYSYVRFSTLEQMAGSSLKRQSELAEKYARENGLELDQTLSLNDFGVSAFKRNNLVSGALGVFMQAVKEGTVHAGSYLLVESLDRISREEPKQALPDLLDILKQGIIVVTLADGREYRHDELSLSELITSLVVLSRAHEESATKSQRLKAAWRLKRENAANRPITSWVPHWLQLADSGSIEIRPERVAVVQAIFNWSETGLGTAKIIRQLEAKDIAPWGTALKKPPKKWNASYISRILSNRAVLGELTLEAKSEAAAERTISGYYPKIIEEDQFLRVQYARSSRNPRKGGGGRKGPYLSNLFSKLLVCGYSIANNPSGYKCAGTNEPISFINKGARSSTPYLQCARVRNGNSGCGLCRKMLRYDDFEIAFINHVRGVNISKLIGSVSEEQSLATRLSEEIETDQARISEINQQLDLLAGAALSEDKQLPATLIAKMHGLESEKTKILDGIKLKQAQFASASKKLNDLRNRKLDIDAVLNKLEAATGAELDKFRHELAHVIAGTVAQIEIYSRGHVVDDGRIAAITEEFGEEAGKVMQANRSQVGQADLPFFNVRFQSGYQQYVIANPADPRDLKASFVMDKHHLIDKVFKLGAGLVWDEKANQFAVGEDDWQSIGG